MKGVGCTAAKIYHVPYMRASKSVLSKNNLKIYLDQYDFSIKFHLKQCRFYL